MGLPCRGCRTDSCSSIYFYCLQF